ncbi:hypothetical protein [uncultured Algibacter sp.]|uniref:hypothetical protein n=1 Tax=uncultured Algibacter sp. TaxID=298659 RepID=UPI0026368C95|nr:hypothetical protein [uncultured Algibacter sp.]
MHIKILTLLSFLILFSACKKTQEDVSENQIEQNKSHEIAETDISNLKYVEYILDFKTEDIIEDWQEYVQLEEIITNIKKGDLVYFKDNEKVIQLLLKELKQNIPAPLKSESINSRILVLETKLLKLESLSNLTTTSKEELLDSIKEFLVAFSNLSFQMNKKVEFDNRSIEKP